MLATNQRHRCNYVMGKCMHCNADDPDDQYEFRARAHIKEAEYFEAHGKPKTAARHRKEAAFLRTFKRQ